MNDLAHIIAALENEHPTVIAAVREWLPRAISLFRGVRRERIRTALDAAHSHLAGFRRDADATVQNRIRDAGES
jgi:hypothetical protein